MNQKPCPTIDIERPDVRNGSETRLHGRWLLIARVGWIGLTLFLLTLNMVMLPRYDAVLLGHCQPGPQCFALQLTAFDRQVLHQFGLSLGFLVAYQVMLDAVSVLVCCALGALLFCAFMLVLFGGAGFTSILQDALAPLSPAWFALIGTLDLLGQSSSMIFFFLFPNGRFVPRWTHWIVPCVVLYWISTIFFVNGQSFWAGPAFVALGLCVVGTQIYRYRRVSTSRERQQTRWIVFGLSIGIVGFLLVLILGQVFLSPVQRQSSVGTTLVSGTIFYGFLLLIPISIATAILRSRLYDVDVVINKALVYGLLTALLAAFYAGLIIGLESLVGLFSRQGAQPLVIVVSTLAIAALFQPLRHRLQQIIDRRFYRRKYDSAKTLEAFSATLRSEVDLSQLSEQSVAVVQETMQPVHVSLWLRPPAHHGNHRALWRATSSVPSEDEARDER
jgi:hypothetical protein